MPSSRATRFFFLAVMSIMGLLAPAHGGTPVTSTSTTLSASTTSPTAGTVVTFSTNVASGSGEPFGGATFYDGTVPLGTSSLQADGNCSYSTGSLSLGTHSITAVYNANTTFASSTSSVVSVTVSAAPAALTPTVVSLAVTKSADQSLLAATSSALNGVPTGTVTFLDSGTILGTATTDATGTAVLQIAKLTSGTHKLFASFSADSQFAPSVSPQLLEQFAANALDFTMIVAPEPLHLNSLGSQPIPLVVLPGAGFRQPVQLACADGVPAGYACSFSPDVLYIGDSSVQIKPSATAVKHGASSRQLFALAFGIVSFVLLGAITRRRTAPTALLMICLGFLLMTGCGAAPTNSHSPLSSSLPNQMTVLTVRATAGSGVDTTIHSSQILVSIRSAE